MISFFMTMSKDMERASYSHQHESSRTIDSHDLDARIELFASAKVTAAMRKCFEAQGPFWNAIALKAPVSIDANDMYDYDFDIVRDADDMARAQIMRMNLGQFVDEHKQSVAELVRIARSEVSWKK